MVATAVPARPRGLALMLNWPRVRFTLLFSMVWGLLLAIHWKSAPMWMLTRAVLLGFIVMLVFGLFEQWPKRLPRWLARWVLQVVGVAVVIPPATAIIFALSAPAGGPPFYHVQKSMQGYRMLTGLGVFVAPWVALVALVR